MKILVLGAAGKTGREVVRQALERGLTVSAFVHTPGSLVPAPGLSIVVGDAGDASAVTAAMAGIDNVICALGHKPPATSSVQTQATRTVLATLPPDGRFISLTGFNVPDQNDPALPLSGRVMGTLIRLLPGRVYDDAAEHARLLRSSQARWVLIRAPRLTMGLATGKYKLGYFRLTGTASIARADVASAMLDQLSTDEWLHKAPMIATSS